MARERSAGAHTTLHEELEAFLVFCVNPELKPQVGIGKARNGYLANMAQMGGAFEVEHHINLAALAQFSGSSLLGSSV